MYMYIYRYLIRLVHQDPRRFPESQTTHFTSTIQVMFDGL